MPKRGSSSQASALPRAAQTIVQQLDFEGTPLIAAITTLRMKSEALEFPGLSLEISPSGREAARHARITLKASNIPIAEACEQIAKAAGLTLTISKKTLIFTDASADAQSAAQKSTPTATSVIRPHNLAAFQNLVGEIESAKVGSKFSAAHWKKVNRALGRDWPAWYQELLKAYPLGDVAFNPPPEEASPDREASGATLSKEKPLPCAFMILGPEPMIDYCEHDYFFVDEFSREWLQFAEATHFGGPSRWLIPADESADPIVHTFSDGDAGPRSLDIRFDDFLIRSTFNQSLSVHPER